MAYKRKKGLLAQKMSGEKKSGVLPMRSPNKNYKNPRDYRVFNMGNEADPPLEMGNKPPTYMKSSGFKMKEGSPFQRNFGVGNSPAKRTAPEVYVTDPSTGEVKDFGTGGTSLDIGLMYEAEARKQQEINKEKHRKELEELGYYGSESNESLAKAYSKVSGENYTAEDIENMPIEEQAKLNKLRNQKFDELISGDVYKVDYTKKDAQERQNLEEGIEGEQYGWSYPNTYYLPDTEKMGPKAQEKEEQRRSIDESVVDLYGTRGKELPRDMASGIIGRRGMESTPEGTERLKELRKEDDPTYVDAETKSQDLKHLSIVHKYPKKTKEDGTVVYVAPDGTEYTKEGAMYEDQKELRDANAPTTMQSPNKMKSSGFKMKEGSPFHRNFGVGDSPAKRVGTHELRLDEQGNVITQEQIPSLTGWDTKGHLGRAKPTKVGPSAVIPEANLGQGEGLEAFEGGRTRRAVVQDGWDAWQNVKRNPKASDADKRAAKNQYEVWKKQVGDQYANRDELISRALSLGKISSAADLENPNIDIKQLAEEVGMKNTKGLEITKAEREKGMHNLADWQKNVVQENVKQSVETGVTPILPGSERIKASGQEVVPVDYKEAHHKKKDKYGKPITITERKRLDAEDITAPTNVYGELVTKADYHPRQDVYTPRTQSEIIYPQRGEWEPASAEYLTEKDSKGNLGYAKTQLGQEMGDMGEAGAMFDSLQESKDIVSNYETSGATKDAKYYKHKKLIENYEKQKNLRDK